MFGHVDDPPSPLLRELEQPQPVWVDLALVYKHVPGVSPSPLPPARVRERAMKPDGLVIGELSKWVRFGNGAWVGLVTYAVPIVGLRSEPVRHFVPAEAVRKRGPKEVEPPF
ncbi:hypothetical protein FKR81_32375 [Lentzea tibetensis]|uniref:Uncharacterized protein n=1 Tax=Lentzea tibetensis TaxID=2591470 RepID=A0A563EKL1_9PSEU|nr:hypothetical protein [Lentzea tibetensis]TWP47412.1 hypothetical protein FKR81_32375 [Lentzea tibetensis]